MEKGNYIKTCAISWWFNNFLNLILYFIFISNNQNLLLNEIIFGNYENFVLFFVISFFIFFRIYG